MKQRSVMEAFMPRSQARAIRAFICGEEGEHFRPKVSELQGILDTMPLTGETDGQGDGAVARLHYFGGARDAWITELDKGSADDTADDYQSQAFGLVDLGYGPKLGYVSIPELLAAGLELDLYWQPRTIGELTAKRAAG